MRAMEKDWVVLTAGTAEEAIQKLAEEDVDVVISDLDLGSPSMNGVDLLNYVQEQHPETVRFVLSGESGRDLMVRTVALAHLFLSKPFDSQELRTNLRRALGLRRILGNSAARALVGTSNRLPSPPRVFREVVSLLSAKRSSVEQLARVIETDIALSAQLIRVVSSAYFGLPQRVRSVQGAIAFLGFQTIKTLVLSLAILQDFVPVKKIPGFDLTELSKNGMLTACIAREIAGKPAIGEDAFAAAMLRDCGRLVLAQRKPVEYTEIVQRAHDEGWPLQQLETEILGVSHAELGAYLLGVWGLPEAVIEAVAHHHLPQNQVATRLDATLAVNLAEKLALDPDVAAEESCSDPAAIDIAHLRDLGLATELPRWREIARAQLSN
jgi:HD-like signal output (HDOD) protein/CheY-like chemotaxis protein